MFTLRELKYLIRDALFEGVEQDRQELVKLYPDQQSDISRLGPKWIMWLMARFGPSAKLKEVHPFVDALVTVKNYSQRDAAISQKYNSSEQWRRAVDAEFPNRKWKNPADVMTMSADDMETLLAMSQRKKQNVDISQVSNVEQDRIGKVGPWNLWMPTTKENSCQIAGYDPATMKPYTTWCTARTTGSNLFYSYVGREGIILFYLIKDDAKSSSDRLSVGFVNGKPVLSGEHGDVSVDGDNDGLTEEDLESLLGGHYDQIMSTLQNVANKHEGNHPALKKIVEATYSVEALKNLIKGLSQQEQDDLSCMIAKQRTVVDEVALYLMHISENVRVVLAANRVMSSNVLTKLSTYTDEVEVQYSVAMHENTPASVLKQQATSAFASTRVWVAKNPNTPIDVVSSLLYDKNEDVRIAVAERKIPIECLKILANDISSYVRGAVASNPRTPRDLLYKFMNGSLIVLSHLARNPALPRDIFEALSNDYSDKVRERIGLNKSTPIDILKKLTSDQSFSVSQAARLTLRFLEETPQQTQERDH